MLPPGSSKPPGCRCIAREAKRQARLLRPRPLGERRAQREGIGIARGASTGSERAPGVSPSPPLKSARRALQGSVDARIEKDEQAGRELSSAGPVLCRPAAAPRLREVAVFPQEPPPGPAPLRPAKSLSHLPLTPFPLPHGQSVYRAGSEL